MVGFRDQRGLDLVVGAAGQGQFLDTPEQQAVRGTDQGGGGPGRDGRVGGGGAVGVGGAGCVGGGGGDGGGQGRGECFLAAVVQFAQPGGEDEA